MPIPILLIILIVIFVITTYGKQMTSQFSPNKDVAQKVKNEYMNYAIGYGSAWGIPAIRILAHICVETEGNNTLVGKAGEIGVMQMLPSTLQYVDQVNGFDYTPEFLQANSWASIETGTAYLAMLYRQLGNIDKASQAYNGSLTNPKTAQYLSKVLAYEKLLKQEVT